MKEFLIYDMKVAVLVAVFYMFYRLLLRHETFHRVNRAVLLGTSVLSFILPLCVITVHRTVQAAAWSVDAEPVTAVLADGHQVGLLTLLCALYIAGVLACLSYTFISIRKVLLLIKACEKHPQADGTVICVTGLQNVAPFSWMRYIVMDRSDYERCDPTILAHEQGHIRLRHSYDVILVDIMTALQWFNPAMWMLRQDLRDIHEYEADAAVLSQGINARQYQCLLIIKAAGIGGYSIANGINHSTLKNRIRMMTYNSKTGRAGMLKLLALIPIAGVALALNANTVYVPENGTPQEKAVTSTQDVNSAESVTEILSVVEEMPVYPGGAPAMMQFLAENVIYPKESKDKGEQGRVLVSFVVEKDGSISEVSALKPESQNLELATSKALQDEAVRVVKSMPRWTPGKQKGEAVRVKYVIPINFRLNEPAEEPAK